MASLGQPTLYKPEYIELAHNYCLLGATNEALGDFVVTRRTIRNWIATHLDFADAVRCGRAVVDAAVVRWLKTAGAKAETTREEVRRHALGKTVNAVKPTWCSGGCGVRGSCARPLMTRRRRAGVLRNAGRSTLAGH
jgi:hypothetical protein